MVDPSKDASKQHIGSDSPSGLDADPMIAKPTTNFKVIQEALLNEIAQNVGLAIDR